MNQLNALSNCVEYYGEKDQFERFLKMIPAPNLADRTRDFRSWIIAWIFIIVWCGGFGIGAGWLFGHITRFLGFK